MSINRNMHTCPVCIRVLPDKISIFYSTRRPNQSITPIKQHENVCKKVMVRSCKERKTICIQLNVIDVASYYSILDWSKNRKNLQSFGYKVKYI